MSRKKYIDRTDIELLNTLIVNPEYTVAELGEEIDLTPGPTHTRLTHLDEEGFFKNTNTIDYSKFGLKQHLFSFKLRGDENTTDQFNPKPTYKKAIDLLSEARESLITSIDLLNDEDDNSYWISISYYPRYSEKSNELRGLKTRNPLEIPTKNEIQHLLKKFITSDSGTLQVLERHEVHPILDNGHVQRKKP